jgi:hypothetical protein
MIVNKSMSLSAGCVKHKGRRRERDDPEGSMADKRDRLVLRRTPRSDAAGHNIW